MDIAERVMNYSKTFPDWPRLIADKGFILGTWMIGQCYKNDTDLYGAYPHGYLKRIMTLFPDINPDKTLHLFAGSLIRQNIPGVMFDIQCPPGFKCGNASQKPIIQGDAHNLSSYFEGSPFDLILADPPYSNEDATHYGTPMVNRNKVVAECTKVLKPGGFLVFLDQVFSMFKKSELKLIGTIGLVRSTNHRVRMVFIWEKL